MARHQKRTFGEVTIAGANAKIGAVTTAVLLRNAENKIAVCSGATKPTDAGAGYAAGCMFVKSDGTVYFNAGTKTSCDFNLMSTNSFTAADLTLTPDANRTYVAMQIGNRVTEKDITMVAANNQNLDPVQLNLNVIGADPTNSSTINNIWQNITHDTIDMPHLRLKNADWNIAIGKNTLDAYCIQTEIDITGTANVTGQCAAISASVQITGVGNHTVGDVQALYASVGGAYGTGTITGAEVTVAKIGVSLTGKTIKAIIEFGAAAYAAATSGLLLDGEGTVTNGWKVDFGSGSGLTNLINFGADAAKNGVSLSCVVNGDASDSDGAIRVIVGSVVYYIPLYAAAHLTSGAF